MLEKGVNKVSLKDSMFPLIFIFSPMWHSKIQIPYEFRISCICLFKLEMYILFQL